MGQCRLILEPRHWSPDARSSCLQAGPVQGSMARHEKQRAEDAASRAGVEGSRRGPEKREAGPFAMSGD